MLRYGPGVALLVVDVQNDFMDPRGALAVRDAAAIVPTINEQIALAQAGGALIVFSQDWHPARTPHFARDGGPWPVHCVRETWGAELYPTLQAADGSPLIRKGTNGEDGYSAFTMRDAESGATVPTPLEMLLHEAGVDRVVIVGVATEYCVASTARDAMALGHHTTVLTDAIAAVNVKPDDGARALEGLKAAGVVLVTAGQR